jgi:hypothetical protein
LAWPYVTAFPQSEIVSARQAPAVLAALAALSTADAADPLRIGVALSQIGNLAVSATPYFKASILGVSKANASPKVDVMRRFKSEDQPRLKRPRLALSGLGPHRSPMALWRRSNADERHVGLILPASGNMLGYPKGV